MKSIKVINTFLIATFCLASAMMAQNGTTKIERQVLERAITALEEYEVNSIVTDEESYYSFIDLFVTPDALVYNDLLGIRDGEYIEVDDYAQCMMTQMSAVQVFYANIKFQKMWQEDGVWKVNYTFEKSMSYFNKCDIHFDTKEYYQNKYQMSVVLTHDAQRQRCRIESLQGRADGNERLPSGFFTLLKSNVKDEKLKFNEQRIVYDEYDQAYLKSYFNSAQFTYPDIDVVLKPEVDPMCHTIKMKYGSNRCMLRPHALFSLGNSMSLGKEDVLESHKSSTMSYGLDFGFSFPSSGKFKTSLFLGAGLTQSTLKMDYVNSDYSFETTIDVNALQYNRHYQDLYLSQEANFTEVSIPVYLELSLKMGTWITAYVDLGAVGNIRASTSLELTRGEAANVYGIYPSLGDLYMDYKWGFNGFSRDVQFDNSQMVDAKVYNAESFALDAMVGAGFRVNLGRTPLQLDLGIRYRGGLMNMVSEDASMQKSTSVRSNLLYNTLDNFDNEEHVNSLARMLGNINRNMLALHVGLVYKF